MTTRITLAGCAGESAGRHHQRDMFAPGIRACESLELAGVYPGRAGAEGYQRALELAAELGVPVLQDAAELAEACEAIVACADQATLDEVLVATRGTGQTVIVDKLALLGTDGVRELADGPDGARLRAAYHPRFHPAVASLAGQLAAGSHGLPHALHGDLIVAHGDGPNGDGDLRHVVVLALEVVHALLGPGGQAVHAVRTVDAGELGAGEATELWTLTITWLPGCLVTLVVGRGGPDVTGTVHRYRLLGSHGQALLDLDSPAFRLVGSGTEVVPFGQGALERELQQLAGGAAEPSAATTLQFSRLFDAAERSAASGQVEEVS